MSHWPQPHSPRSPVLPPQLAPPLRSSRAWSQPVGIFRPEFLPLRHASSVFAARAANSVARGASGPCRARCAGCWPAAQVSQDARGPAPEGHRPRCSLLVVRRNGVGWVSYGPAQANGFVRAWQNLLSLQRAVFQRQGIISRLVELACRQIKHHDLAVRFVLQRRRVLAYFLAPPPISRLAFRPHVREPVLILDRARLSRRRAREWIARKQRQHVRLIFQQTFFRPHHKARLLPRSQRREPQIPLEPRLIRRVNSRRFINCLRLVTKRVRDPRFSVQRALKFDLITLVRHHRKKPIRIRDAKRFERLHRLRGQRQSRHEHPKQQRRRGIKDQSKAQAREPSAQRRKSFAPFRPSVRGRWRRYRRTSSSYRVLAVNPRAEPLRQDPFQKSVVQQQHAQQQHQIVQKRIVRRRNNRNLKRRHNKKACTRSAVPPPVCKPSPKRETSAASAARTIRSTSAAGHSGSNRPSR